MKEQQVQAKLIKELRLRGWIAVKTDTRTARGYPDITAFKDGQALLVEVKTDTGVLSKHQKLFIERLREAGIDTRVVSGIDGVNELLNEL